MSIEMANWQISTEIQMNIYVMPILDLTESFYKDILKVYNIEALNIPNASIPLPIHLLYSIVRRVFMMW